MKALNEMTNEELVALFSCNTPEKDTLYVVGTDDEGGFEREITWEQFQKVEKYIRLGNRMHFAPKENFLPVDGEAFGKVYDEQTEVYKELLAEGVFRSKYDVRQEVKTMTRTDYVKYMQGAKAYKEAFWKYIDIIHDFDEDED